MCEIGKYLEHRTVPFGSYGRDLLHLGIHDYYLSIVITIMIEMVQSLAALTAAVIRGVQP